MGPEYSAWPQWGNEFISLMTVGFRSLSCKNYTSLMISFTKTCTSAQCNKWVHLSYYCTMRVHSDSNMHDRLHQIKNANLLSLTWHNYSPLVTPQSRPEMHVGDMNNQVYIRRYQANLIVIIVQIFRPCYKLDYIDTPSPNNLYILYKHLTSASPM